MRLIDFDFGLVHGFCVIAFTNPAGRTGDSRHGGLKMKSLPKILTCLTLLAILPQAAQGGDPEIAYAASCGGNMSCIWVMDADGSNKRTVYQGAHSGLWPSWSPDGVSLAFEDNWALYRIDVDHLTVYPDGQLLAPREGELLDGRTYQSIADAEWSPLGHEIGVRTLTPSAICVIDESGGTLEAIYTAPEGSHLVTSPAWNSDGTRIAVFEESNTRQLIIIDRQTGMVEQSFDVEGQMPDWARKDDRIAFNFQAGWHFRDTWVSTVRLADSIVSPVVKGRWPTWSPDDSQIVFTDTKGKLKRYTFATGEVETLGEGASADWRRLTPECAVDTDCAAGEICCSGTCIPPQCAYDIECDDFDICTDDTCYPCSGCENVFDASNDPSCQATCTPTHEKEKGPRCSDGIDNDCDDLIDGADPDCW